MQRIVFGLKDVYNAQCANAGIGLTSSALELNIPGLGYGYLLAGEFPVITTVDRYDLATETMSQPGTNLPQGRAQHQSFADPNNYGYYGGGYNGPPAAFFSNTFRYDFSNETITDISQNAPEGNRNRRARLYNPSYGYFVGGSPTSKIDRLDFSTQTYTSPGNLPSVVEWAGTTSSPSYGYVGGGETPSLTCIIQRLDFSVETISSPGGLPTSVGQICQTIESNTTGYWGGGYIPGGAVTTCHIERLDFSTEVASKNPGYMSIKRSRGSAIKSPGFGYFCNGNSPPYISAISRLDFSTDTVSENPPVGRSAAGRASFEINRPQVFKYVPGNSVWKEEPNYGYFGGGYLSPPFNRSTTIDRIDFSSETTSNPSAKLSQARETTASAFNSSYGYFGGGNIPPSFTRTTVIDRLDFSTEVSLISTGKLTQARGNIGAVSSPKHGYFIAGSTGSDVCTIDRLDFSNETVTDIGDLSQAINAFGAAFNNDYGYTAGGSPDRCIISRIDFSTETTSNISAGLNYARRGLTGTQNSLFGYFAGGVPGGGDQGSKVDRLDFATETTSPLPNIPQGRRYMGAVASFAYGYWGGGDAQPPRVCTISRLDFTTDTFSSPSNQLTQNRDGLIGVSGGVSTRRVGKATYGYFAGGGNPNNVCTIDRLDFATETIAPNSVIPQLTQARKAGATISNNSYGYYGGGFNPTPAVVCTIDRLDFSNETVKANPGQLTQARRGLAGVSNSNYGYFGGGYTSVNVCTIDRLDFSNETVAAPGTYQLTQARRELIADQSNSYGYFAGGTTGSEVCTIDRIDFSTETVSANPGQLTQARRNASAVSNNFYGYFAGGGFPGICTIDRLDFSSETVSANPGQLTQARRTLAGTQSSSYGYFGGGIGPADSSTIDRLDFSNDTVSLPSQKLTQARRDLSAFSNG